MIVVTTIYICVRETVAVIETVGASEMLTTVEGKIFNHSIIPLTKITIIVFIVTPMQMIITMLVLLMPVMIILRRQKVLKKETILREVLLQVDDISHY